MSIVMSIMNVTLKCQALIRRGDPASLAAALRTRSEFHSHVGFLYLVLAKLVKRGCVDAKECLPFDAVGALLASELTHSSQLQSAPGGYFVASRFQVLGLSSFCFHAFC